METTTNPLAAFQAYQSHMAAQSMKIDRKTTRFETTITLTGGTKETRTNAILSEIWSPKGFRLARTALESSDGLKVAAKIVVVRRDRKESNGMVEISMFAADGSQMWAEYMTVGPRGGFFYGMSQ